MSARYTQSNLETEGIRDIIDCSLDPDGVLVEEDHPIVELLQGAGRLDMKKIKRWIRLERHVVRSCSTALINDGFGLVRPAPATPTDV